jgi:hypothetical protein
LCAEENQVRVFLDSSAIISSGDYLESPEWAALDRYAGRNDIEILIPKIVIEEVLNRFRESLEKKYKSYVESRRRIMELAGKKAEDDVSDKDIQEILKNHQQRLTYRFSRRGYRILDYPSMQHVDMVRRALGRVKPFAPDGRGYRDALIWYSIIEEMRRDPTEALFVTENTKDFASGQGDNATLHLALARDLAENNLPPRAVGLVTSLDALIRTHLETYVERMSAIERQVIDGTFQDGSFQDHLLRAVDHFLARIDPWDLSKLTGFNVDDDMNWATTRSIHKIVSVDARRLGWDQIQVVTRAIFEIEMSVDTVEGLVPMRISGFAVPGYDSASQSLNAYIDVSVSALFDDDVEDIVSSAAWSLDPAEIIVLPS